MGEISHLDAHEVAFELMDGSREWTADEVAFILNYRDIVARTNRSKQAAVDMFGRTSKTALAAIYRAVDEEKVDLKRALVSFDNAVERCTLQLVRA